MTTHRLHDVFEGSFGSIRMHPIAELDIEKYFPNRSPDAKVRPSREMTIAGYEDKACISACPADALFQIDGTDLFNSWQQFNAHRRPGFDSVESPQTVPKRLAPFWVIFAILNTLVLSWECFGRLL